MKKSTRMISLLLVAVMLFGLVACGGTEESKAPASTAPSGGESSAPEASGGNEIKGKIGIMSNGISQVEESYRHVESLKKAYPDMVVLDTFPTKNDEVETTISKVMAMASDPDIKAIIFTQALVGTIASIEKLKDVRPDIFTICCNPSEDVDQVADVADMVLIKSHNAIADMTSGQAIENGATDVIMYYTPRLLANQVVAIRTERMKATLEENGINFHQIAIPDPSTGDGGPAATQQFVMEDIPRQVEQLGNNIVIHGISAAINEVMIKGAVENKAIFALQTDPTPFEGFPGALNISVPEEKSGDNEYILSEIDKKVKELGMEGRLSTWNCSAIMAWNNTAFAYAKEIAAGNLDSETLDFDAAAEAAIGALGEGAAVEHYINAEGVQRDNVLTLSAPLYVFGLN